MSTGSLSAPTCCNGLSLDTQALYPYAILTQKRILVTRLITQPVSWDKGVDLNQPTQKALAYWKAGSTAGLSLRPLLVAI